ncbi:hypothetical protein V2I01_34825 [Micromonospora sp. BRA006-A]|nr:hypothetical protein [Micromonospora sp. BRA006-A]
MVFGNAVWWTMILLGRLATTLTGDEGGRAPQVAQLAMVGWSTRVAAARAPGPEPIWVSAPTPAAAPSRTAPRSTVRRVTGVDIAASSGRGRPGRGGTGTARHAGPGSAGSVAGQDAQPVE